MNDRLVSVISRLESDLANLEKSMTHVKSILKELLKETRQNGRTQSEQLDTIQATQRFLANQQPRRDGAYPYRAWRDVENDDHD